MKTSTNVYSTSSSYLTQHSENYKDVLLVHLEGQDLSSSPHQFPPNAIYINLNDCDIESFDAFSIPDKVEILNMDDNEDLTMDATKLPKNIGVLSLNNTNSLNTFSDTILKNLRTLSLFGSGVQHFERNYLPFLSDLRWLKSWDGASSEIKVISNNYIGLVETFNLEGGGSLETFTDNTCPSTTSLNLNGNVLTSFDNSNKLPALTHLSLSANKISSFSFVPSSNLLSLDLSSNNISGVFDVSTLPSTLTKLNISSNSIKSIKGLEKLVNLTELHAKENKIKHIDLSPLLKLEVAKLSFNRLTEFNKEGKPLSPNLTKLDLSDNPIQEINLGVNHNITSLSLASITQKRKKVRPSVEVEEED